MHPVIKALMDRGMTQQQAVAHNQSAMSQRPWADTNNDGYLSNAEWGASSAEKPKESSGGSGGNQSPAPSSPTAAASAGNFAQQYMQQMIDAGRFENIQQAQEHNKHAIAQGFDLNNDGVVTDQEFTQYQQQGGGPKPNTPAKPQGGGLNNAFTQAGATFMDGAYVAKNDWAQAILDQNDGKIPRRYLKDWDELTNAQKLLSGGSKYEHSKVRLGLGLKQGGVMHEDGKGMSGGAATIHNHPGNHWLNNNPEAANIKPPGPNPSNPNVNNAYDPDMFVKPGDGNTFVGVGNPVQTGTAGGGTGINAGTGPNDPYGIKPNQPEDPVLQPSIGDQATDAVQPQDPIEATKATAFSAFSPQLNSMGNPFEAVNNNMQGWTKYQPKRAQATGMFNQQFKVGK